MADYGQSLQFGVFITPDRRRRRPRGGPVAGGRHAGPGHPELPGPPVPGEVPGHVDAAEQRGRAHQQRAAGAQRGQPAAAPAGGAGPQRGHAGHPQRRPRPAGAGLGRVLGRHRRAGRAQADAGPGRGRADRGAGRDPGHVVGRALGHGRGRVLLADRRASRARAAARHRGLAGRLQAAHAGADRRPRRRLDPQHGLRRPARARPAERGRSTRRRTRPGATRARSAGSTTSTAGSAPGAASWRAVRPTGPSSWPS